MCPEIPAGIRRIDLNADLGEGVTDDDELLKVVTSANVACGFHAGDASIMAEVCDRAAERGVVVGAQVSYADREGFGRRPTSVRSEVLTAWVREQVDVLAEIARAAGIRVEYVKAHGALYNRVADDAEQALAVLAGSGDLPVLGLPGSVLLERAAELGRSVLGEGFPDRGYTGSGRLVPRSEPGALVHGAEAIAANAVALAGRADIATVCVHGDSPGAVRAARMVRDGLRRAGFEVGSWLR